MAGGGSDSEFEVNINLTALLDVLTNLLFFLMLGMAAADNAVELDGKLELPDSSAEATAAKAWTLTLTRADLLLDKEPIAKVQGDQIRGVPPGKRIDALHRRLLSRKAEQRGGGEADDALLVLCDRDTDYALLHQVLNTAAEAGFARFRMGVVMR